MGLSLDDCRRLNIPLHLHPAYNGKSERDVLREHFGVVDEPPKPKRAKSDDGYDSKLNRDFAECLRSAKARIWIREWWYEPFGLRLAPKCFYHFDFLVEPCRYTEYDPATGYTTQPETRLYCIEVKGGWFRDDAKVKTKVAAEKFPCFRWLLVTREGRHGWQVREVDHRGIGNVPIHVPWI